MGVVGVRMYGAHGHDSWSLRAGRHGTIVAAGDKRYIITRLLNM